MIGGIACRGRLLVVARAAARGEIAVFDLETGRLHHRFPYSGDGGGWSDAGGIDLTADGRIFLTDTGAGRIRVFSSFGREVGGFGPPPGAVAPRDRRGLLAYPRAVRLDDESRLWVLCGDRPWVHGLQIFDQEGRFLASLPAFGERGRTFGPALDLDQRDGRMWIADTGNGVLQVFRLDGVFEAAHPLGPGLGGRPLALAARREGLVLLCLEPAPRVVLVDPSLRRLGTCRPPREVGLHHPCGVAVAADGRILVLDRDGARVLAFDAAGAFLDVLLELPA